jgi:hypothetical protein
MYHTTAHDSQEITIRLAGPEHADQLRRLAQRDSAGLPNGELLVAFVGGRLRAAISISDGRAIADPFHPTAGLVSLLSERVVQLRPPKRRGLRSRLGRRPRGERPRRRGSLSPQPAGTLRALD